MRLADNVAPHVQGFVVSEAGQQPDLFGEDTEDARLLGPQFQEPSGETHSLSAINLNFM